MANWVLFRKLRRDIGRQRWQFLAAAAVLAIGVAVYVAATDAYANLKQSFSQAYAVQLLPDAVLSGPAATGLAQAARVLPGEPIVDTRRQGDVGIRINGHALLGRAVAVPVSAQPAVSQLAMRSGQLPATGQVVAEEHLSHHYGLRPGDTVELLGPTGWLPMLVSGSALSTEYFWPARSQQEILTTPEHFGVVFITAPDLPSVVPQPTDQLLLYAHDRSAAPALVAGAAQLARGHGLAFESRDEQPSYRALQDDVDAVGAFAKLLPWVFLVAAAVGAYVLLSRLVAAQRAVIGTLTANGLSGSAVRGHYLGFGIAVGIAGAASGMAGGYVLGGWFTTQYTQALGLPLHVTSVHPISLIVGAGVGVASAAVAAWAPARTASRMSPAEAMRISPSRGRGAISVMERILPPLRAIPARWRMALRGVSRNRRRTLLTVSGVVISVCLVMVFAGLRDTVSSVIDRQYGSIELQDAQVITAPGAADTVAAALRTDPRIAAVEQFTRMDVTLDVHNRRYDTLLIGFPQHTEMHRFNTGDDGGTLPAKGVLLGSGLGREFGINVGDVVTFTEPRSGLRIQEPVAGFVDEQVSPVGYISAEQLSGRVSASGLMIKLAPGVSETAVARTVTALPGVAAYASTGVLASMMRKAFSLYDALVGLMLVFAGVMAAALLYNAMSANVGERTGELGSLQAAGMGAGVLGRLIAAENMLLVIVGLPVGLIAGTALADWFMLTFKTQGYSWHLDMHTATPFIVAGAVLVAALLAQIPALRSVYRIDVAKVVRERSL